jgi:hypothetical protein
MRNVYRTLTRLTAAGVIVAMTAASGLAAPPKTEPVEPRSAKEAGPGVDPNTGKPYPKIKKVPAPPTFMAIPPIPRSIPDMNTTYWDHDVLPSPVFDINKLTVSGDIRVRPEFRTNACFGGSISGTLCQAPVANPARPQDNRANAMFVQQWVRLGFNYDISPDVAFFVQGQVSNNWGTPGGSGAGATNNPITTGNTFFLRQGFMTVRNFLIPNLTLKAGRQMMVWGNHRIFGHFDWNNVAWSHDGLTFRYNHDVMPVEFGWLRNSETDLAQNHGGGFLGSQKASGDSDLLFVRVPMTFKGSLGSLAFEPTYIYESGGTGAGALGQGTVGGQQPNQRRSTVGARVAFNAGIFDGNMEGYWQFGQMGAIGATRDTTINALAGAAQIGVTLPVPMTPRIAMEINYASGSGNCDVTLGTGCGGTFSQLFPTNHIVFGSMDLISWQNMLTWGPTFAIRPTDNSHFEVMAHMMYLADRNDHWYGVTQNVMWITPDGNQNRHLGNEIDITYTQFLMNGKVGWQIAYGYFMTGNYLEQAAIGANANQSWGYTQLWVNF